MRQNRKYHQVLNTLCHSVFKFNKDSTYWNLQTNIRSDSVLNKVFVRKLCIMINEGWTDIHNDECSPPVISHHCLHNKQKNKNNFEIQEGGFVRRFSRFLSWNLKILSRSTLVSKNVCQLGSTIIDMITKINE